MEKLDKRQGKINLEEIVKSLNLIKKDTERQVIILDTVVSGRAASQITSAFENLGHPVIPVLAVHRQNFEVKFDNNLRMLILNSTRKVAELYQLNPRLFFEEFPLISEDGGAALLGVTALNFADFNREGVFNEVDKRFDYLFFPQSCIWAIPPGDKASTYLELFQAFLNQCRNPGNQNWDEWKEKIKAVMVQHGRLPKRELCLFSDELKGAKAIETSSHIISVNLTKEKVDQWIREFADFFYQ